MNVSGFLLPALFCAGLFAASCQSQESDPDDAAVSMSTASLCSGCGEIKGSTECCDADAMTCPSCDLAAGSPGCCKIEKGAGDVAYCTACTSLAADCQCQE